jgi:hypothetical protein
MSREPLWKCGFEVELMAPKGKSRETLANALALALGGSCRRTFYPQSEIDTQRKGAGFETLTLAFEVLDSAGVRVCLLADDTTLNSDIDHEVEGASGWYRILSSHRAPLDLVELHCDPEAALPEVLGPIARLFHTDVTSGSLGMRRVDGPSGTVVAALPLAGDRERACEIITRPLLADHRLVLGILLDAARSQGFFVPRESATHIHFDGTRLQDPRALRNVALASHRFREVLRARWKTNPACTRLGPWPRDALELVASSKFLALTWSEAARALDATSLRKWCDFNALNLVDRFARKRTFEVRILPTTLSADALVEAALFFEAFLERALACEVLSPLPTLAPEASADAALAAFLDAGTWGPTPSERKGVSTPAAPTPITFKAPLPAAATGVVKL